MPNHLTTLIIWQYFSFAWTEVGLGEDDILQYAQQLQAHQVIWADIENVFYRQVLWGFAWHSLCMCVVIIPIVGMLIMAHVLPEWQFEEKYLQKKMQHIQQKAWLYYLNPVCWFGYILAWMMSYGLFKKLKRAYAE